METGWRWRWRRGWNEPSKLVLYTTLTSLSLSPSLLRLGALDRSVMGYVCACQASLIRAVYLGPCFGSLLGDRLSVSVLSTRSLPQSPSLPKRPQDALRDAPSGLLALPEARPWSSGVDAYPLPSKLVATVKLCYTPCEASKVCWATSL